MKVSEKGLKGLFEQWFQGPNVRCTRAKCGYESYSLKYELTKELPKACAKCKHYGVVVPIDKKPNHVIS